MLAEDIRHPERQPIVFERRKNIRDKKRDKRVRDGDSSRERSLKRGEVSKHQEILSLAGLWGVVEFQRAT